MKKWTKKLLPLLSMTAIFAFVLFLFSPEEAAAAWKKAGITPQGDLKNSKSFQDMTNIIYFITAIGGFWVIACLLFAGMKLSAAQGGNPQARTQGFIGIVMAGVGCFIIVKATDIAGWFAGFGGG